ncbi:MAG: MarR family transcriptional regulator [Zavarzinella sp.]
MSTGKLKDELKKKNEFDSPCQEAILNILRTSDVFHNAIGRLLREYGLTQSQYNVLRILRGEGTPMPCQEISNRMIQVVPAMTGLLDRLEAQDYIVRERSAEDRRSVFISLTERATEVLSMIDQPIEQMHEALIGHLNEEELKELSRLLEKARTAG